jgi:hypothetical protein
MVELNLGPNSASPAPVGGRRHGKSHKLRLVKKKTVRRMLAKKGLKMRGGGEGAAATASPMGGRRRTRRRGRSLFRF